MLVKTGLIFLVLAAFLLQACARRGAFRSGAEIRDLEPLLDPELRPVFSSFAALDAGLESVPRDRRALDAWLETAPRSKTAETVVIPGTAGNPKVGVRVYRSSRDLADGPVLVWLHGGGWTLGRPEMDEMFLQHLADEVPLTVVSVDYRLAPEHPFPAALQDAQAALDWVRDPASGLRADSRRVFVGGTSAGAAIAAGLALKERDEGGEKSIAFQLLLFPALDARLETPSMRAIRDPRTIHREFMRSRWKAWLGGARATPHASPALARDFSGLPDAAVIAAELDPLRDEAVAYARRLRESGAGCDLRVFRGGIHGFDAIVPDAAISREARKTAVDALRRASAR